MIMNLLTWFRLLEKQSIFSHFSFFDTFSFLSESAKKFAWEKTILTYHERLELRFYSKNLSHVLLRLVLVENEQTENEFPYGSS